MNEKYISNETKRQLKILKIYRKNVNKMTPEEAKNELLKTGLYKKDGRLIDELRN